MDSEIQPSRTTEEQKPTYTPEELKKVVSYLASSKASIRLRPSVLNGHRVTYCKGKRALSALESNPLYATHALHVLETLVLEDFMLRVEKVPKQKRLMAVQFQSFDVSGYYVLRHEPNPLFMILGSIALVCVVLAAVMFPLWPNFMKIGVMYLSYFFLGILAFLFLLAILRLVIYIPLWISGRPGWLLPNLFADAGIIESFFPLWAWEETTSAVPKTKKTN